MSARYRLLWPCAGECVGPLLGGMSRGPECPRGVRVRFIIAPGPGSWTDSRELHRADFGPVQFVSSG